MWRWHQRRMSKGTHSALRSHQCNCQAKTSSVCGTLLGKWRTLSRISSSYPQRVRCSQLLSTSQSHSRSREQSYYGGLASSRHETLVKCPSTRVRWSTVQFRCFVAKRKYTAYFLLSPGCSEPVLFCEVAQPAVAVWNQVQTHQNPMITCMGVCSNPCQWYL